MEHNPRVEGIAKRIATLILILGIISGVVLIIAGFANDDGATTILITGGIVDVISSVIFWVFVPRSENDHISKLCEAGYDDIFDVRINRVSPEESPENQIGVIVSLIHKN